MVKMRRFGFDPLSTKEEKEEKEKSERGDREARKKSGSVKKSGFC